MCRWSCGQAVHLTTPLLGSTPQHLVFLSCSMTLCLGYLHQQYFQRCFTLHSSTHIQGCNFSDNSHLIQNGNGVATVHIRETILGQTTTSSSQKWPPTSHNNRTRWQAHTCVSLASSPRHHQLVTAGLPELGVVTTCFEKVKYHLYLKHMPTFSAVRFQTVTVWPIFSKLDTMPLPIRPSPRNPILRGRDKH